MASHRGPGCFRPCPQRTWWVSPHASCAQHVTHVRCSRWMGSPAIQVPACGGAVVSNTANAQHASHQRLAVHEHVDVRAHLFIASCSKMPVSASRKRI
eukprot:15974036-Heterocapsa_arctica.AAC.1